MVFGLGTQIIFSFVSMCKMFLWKLNTHTHTHTYIYISHKLLMSLKSKNQSLELLDIIKTKVVKVVEILHKFVFGKRFIHQVENDFN